MIKSILGNTYISKMELYFKGIEKFSNLESSLVRSAVDLNMLSLKLFQSKRVPQLRALSEVILHGFMQYSIYDLYRLALMEMPLEEELVSMANRLNIHNKKSFMDLGFDDKDMICIKKFNESMSVLIENVILYEKSHYDLIMFIKDISNKEGSEFAQDLSGYIEAEFGAVGGAAYLIPLHKYQKENFDLAQLTSEMGFTTIGFKKYI